MPFRQMLTTLLRGGEWININHCHPHTNFKIHEMGAELCLIALLGFYWPALIPKQEHRYYLVSEKGAILAWDYGDLLDVHPPGIMGFAFERKPVFDLPFIREMRKRRMMRYRLVLGGAQHSSSLVKIWTKGNGWL